MSFLFGGQLLTDNLILQLVYIFIVPFPVWAGINFDSISGLGWNEIKFYFLFGLELILIPFPVLAGIDINSSPNCENVHRL